MGELVYLAFYILVIRMIVGKKRPCETRGLETWLKEFKQSLLLGAKFKEPNSRFSSEKTDANSIDSDFDFIKHSLVSSLYSGRNTVEVINNLLGKIQNARQFRKTVDQVFYNLVARLTLIVFLALVGRWGLKILHRSTVDFQIAHLDQWSLVVSLILVFALIFIIQAGLPRPWFEIDPLSYSSKNWIETIARDEPIKDPVISDIWSQVKAREKFAGVSLSDEKKLICQDWNFSLVQGQDKSIEKFQNLVPVIEILGGSCVGALILVVPLLTAL